MKGKPLSMLMVIVLLALVGCGSGTEIARSDKHQETPPNVSETDLVTPVDDTSLDEALDEISTKIAELIIGYEDGTETRLVQGTPEFDEIAREALAAVLLIDSQHMHVVLPQGREEWRSTNKYVLIRFGSPTPITTKIAVSEDKKDRYPGGFKILQPLEILIPLSNHPNEEIRMLLEISDNLRSFPHGQPLGQLEEMVDGLR